MFEWYNFTFQSLLSFWQGILKVVPMVIGALIVFIIGWFVSVGVGRIIVEVLKKAGFNKLFEKGSWKEAMSKAEIKVDPSEFIGAICKWILVLVFLLAAVEILNLTQFAIFLTSILKFIPNIVVAVLIFVVAVVLADFVEKLIRVSVESVKVGYGQLAGAIGKWSLWIFAILAILLQLKIAPFLLQTLFTGFVALFAIAGGIAFGLGGKDVASEILQYIKKKVKE